MKALITAGGHGTRLRPITHTQNKHLIPIANKIMLGYAIDYVQDAGINEIGIIINAGDKSISDVFGNRTKRGAAIKYIPQDAPLGLAHVVKISEDFIGSDPFIFYLGDNILVGGVGKFVSEFKNAETNCHLALSKVSDPNRFGVAEIKDNQIIGIEEKPDNPKSDLAVTGIYLYDSSIFEAVNNIKPSARGELEISDAHQYLLDNGYKISYSEITGWWKDTGKPSDLLEANRLILENIDDRRIGNISNSTINGNIDLALGAQVINSKIDGPVIIGEKTIIENSYIGPHTAIRNRCKVIKSEVLNSIIMSDSKITNVKNRIEASLLGNDVKISGNLREDTSHRFILGDHSRAELN